MSGLTKIKDPKVHYEFHKTQSDAELVASYLKRTHPTSGKPKPVKHLKATLERRNLMHLVRMP